MEEDHIHDLINWRDQGTAPNPLTEAEWEELARNADVRLAFGTLGAPWMEARAPEAPEQLRADANRLRWETYGAHFHYNPMLESGSRKDSGFEPGDMYVLVHDGLTRMMVLLRDKKGTLQILHSVSVSRPQPKKPQRRKRTATSEDAATAVLH
jgi:hypothetical protein